MNEAPHGDKSTDPVKITLAEADKDDQQNFKEAVADAHIKGKVTTMDTGQELMDNLKDVTIPNPDVIFMELNMELDNGKDVLTEMKKDNDLKDIPTVMYTTSTNTKDVEHSFMSGASLYLPKPVFFRNLVRIIRMIFTLQWQAVLSKPVWKNFFISEMDINRDLPSPDAAQIRTIRNKKEAENHR